jgi:hypothetical protein
MEVGKLYSVPCVQVRQDYLFRTKFLEWIPVLPNLHDEIEIDGDPIKHYHADSRFINPELKSYLPAIIETWLVSTETTVKELPYFQDFTDKQPAYFPFLSGQYLVLKQNVTLKKLVCPHQNYPLDECTPDENGTVTCPLHGLKWNIHTKKLDVEATIKQLKQFDKEGLIKFTCTHT